IGMTWLVLMTELDAEQQRMLETVRTCGDHLLALINDILDFSKHEAGKMEFETLDFNLRALIEDLGDILAPRREWTAGALAELARRAGGRVTFTATPVDATRVPPDLLGLRTMVNAFHHLPPEAARAVLQDAVDQRRPLAVIEVVSRTPAMFLAVMAAPLTFALTLPLQRPVRPSHWLLTYVVPVLPAFVWWDGVVSWLRIYHPHELGALVGSLRGTEGWSFEVGTFALGGPARGVYLEATPPTA
ncbi:MAG: histidine kinase dimerization/phospho-acceptor domain-containing protein, partial [Myxococcota bacterium]